jgi:hypothetical protein
LSNLLQIPAVLDSSNQYDSGPAVVPAQQIPMAPAPPVGPAPDISTPTPPPSGVDLMAHAFITHLLQRTPPPPQPEQQNPTQNSGSFADKLSRAVQGAGASLGDASHASDNLRSGQGWLSGVTNTLGARNTRVAATKQQDIENQQRQQQLDQQKARDQQAMAESNVRMVHEQKLTHQLDEAAINSSIEDGKKAVAAQTVDAAQPGQVIEKDYTSNELQTQIAQKKLDPTTVTVYPTGRKQVGENPDGTPQYATTYTVVTPPKSVTLDDENRKALSNLPNYDQLTPGTVLTGVQYNQLYQQSADVKAATAARNATLAQNEIATDQTAQKLESVRLGPDWNNALSNHNNDPVAALDAMEKNPAMRQKYPHLQEDVAQAYGGAKEFETIRHNQEEEKIAKQKLYNEQHPAGGAMGNIPQSDGMKEQIAQLRTANPTAAAVLDKFDPLTQASLMAVAFGDGSVDFDKVFPTRLTKGAPGITSQNAIAVLKQINPNFQEQQYRQTMNAYKEATSGKNSQAIQQYNNFIQHSAEAVDTLVEANRKGPRIFNSPLNKLENLGYGTDATNIQAALSAVRGEISLLLSGGYKPGEDEQKAINTILSDASTPAQLSGALQKYATMGTVRLDNINENYKRTTGKNLPRIIDQRTLDAAKHLGVDPKTYGTLQGLDSNGTIFGSQTPMGANPPKQQPPQGVPQGSVLMQVPGGQPHWIPPQNIDAARKAGAAEVK